MDSIVTPKEGAKSFIFIGRSGCGKGTQAKLLIDFLAAKEPERKVLYIQTGLELREFIKGDTHTQNIAKNMATNGGLIPEFLAIYFWSRKISTEYTEGSHLIMDGMPRKQHEAQVLDSVFGFYGIVKPVVIHLNVSRLWSSDRMVARGRADDSHENIKNRLDWFEKEVVPTINYYKTNPMYQFMEIDGERTISEIHKDIIASL
ncbi:MAG TPA: nucleoside monophosphate kinase [Candidatus Paceibacterota bacterium]|nr:nucleoside monophosphate kinase [Candidatus Paceibacterota bacterium]